jgi:hypothetical protein
LKISQSNSGLVVEDGRGAQYGAGILVPAVLASIFICLIWPQTETRFALAGFNFLATASVLALLRPPRRTVFDRERQEARVTIGWPPFGRRRMIPFADVAEAKVWRLLDLGELGHARPALVLQSGETVFLSTYSRSPVACREIVRMLEDLLPRPTT